MAKRIKAKNTGAKIVSVMQDAKRRMNPEPFSCLQCGGVKWIHVVDLPETDFCGELPNGWQYTKVLRDRVACAHCGQQSVVKTFEFDPMVWEGTK